MKPQIKKLWIEALRSGEYEQTQGCLRDETGFCCLGVLTDLYLKEHDEDWTAGDGIICSENRNPYSAHEEVNYLPEDVRIWAGLLSQSPTVVTRESSQDSGIEALANLNDSGKSFQEIAQIIEEQV